MILLSIGQSYFIVDDGCPERLFRGGHISDLDCSKYFSQISCSRRVSWDLTLRASYNLQAYLLERFTPSSTTPGNVQGGLNLHIG